MSALAQCTHFKYFLKTITKKLVMSNNLSQALPLEADCAFIQKALTFNVTRDMDKDGYNMACDNTLL